MLDHNAELAEFADEMLRTAVSLELFHPESGKAPVEVVADYLRHVLTFAWGVIGEEFGVLVD